jgi:hypothetical protein
MKETSKPPNGIQDMLNAAMGAEASRQRLAKRVFDAEAPETLNAQGRGGRGGGKLSRSETVTVRLDPKLRYLAELAARLHRRTLSSYIEWSIESSLSNNQLAGDHNGPSIKDESEYLWDVDDADRFAKLALRYSPLLTHEEQVRWKLIRENGFLWKGAFRGGPGNEWAWTIDEGSLIFSRLREHWAAFAEVAETGQGHDKLPTWKRFDPEAPRSVPRSSTQTPAHSTPASMARAGISSAPKSSTGFDDMDDEIPF